MAILIVTIDGPAGSGKSTVAKVVADKLGAVFLDTGAMYRAVAMAAMMSDYDIEDAAMMENLLKNTSFSFKCENDKMVVEVDGQDITEEIRSPEVTSNVHFIASEPTLRAYLVEMQREFARNHKKVITEGRDQGTIAFPYADVKFYLNADDTERARRRMLELKERGIEKTIDDVLQAIRHRDAKDMNRTTGPLIPAEDAIIVDTTEMTVNQVVEEIICQINKKKTDL